MKDGEKEGAEGAKEGTISGKGQAGRQREREREQFHLSSM